MVKRLLLAAALLAIIHFVVLALRQERWPSEVASSAWDLAKLPREVETWEGRDTELDEKTFASLKSEQVVDRLYRNRSGGALLLHTSSYTLLERWVPHPPEVCYGNAGFQLDGRKDRDLQLDEGRSVRVRLLTFKRKGERILVLFWYQFGNEVVLDHASLRSARWKLIGQKTWPAITKFMLQTGVAGAGQAEEEQLCRFAESVLAWTLTPQSRRSEGPPPSDAVPPGP